ncbi:MAG: hypothetical protein WA738_16705 [Candidatus Angelobacter sp.]
MPCRSLKFVHCSAAKTSQRSLAAAAKGMMMVTIFLKYDQSKTLDEIEQHLKH